MVMMKIMVLWSVAFLMSSGVVAEQVDMSNASLTHIPPTKQTNVTHLILSHNSIVMTVSDVKTLQEYPMIRALDLSYNLIKTLPQGAFDKLTNLETLKLRGNGLETLDEDIFKGLTKLTSVDLEGNPWSCSCALAGLVRRLNESGACVGKGLSCHTPKNTSVLDLASFCSSPSTSASSSTERSRPAATARATSAAASGATSAALSGAHANASSKELSAGADGTPAGSSSWKFLLGVVVLTLGTSVLIVCAVKSPSWYKLLFNYRHQRLREDVEPNVFNSGRFSNFSLDTEQTETSAQELDEGLEPFEDDDGFIEDVYIEPGNYSQNTDANES